MCLKNAEIEWPDAEVGSTLEPVQATEGSRVFESRDNLWNRDENRDENAAAMNAHSHQGETIVLRAPGVSSVLESYKICPEN